VAEPDKSALFAAYDDPGATILTDANAKARRRSIEISADRKRFN
jgi:hypothetical protein